jgi:hypothetical protein
VAIVSDRRDADGMPRVINLYPPMARESRRLDDFGPIHSHFRLTQAPPRRVAESEEDSQ